MHASLDSIRLPCYVHIRFTAHDLHRDAERGGKLQMLPHPIIRHGPARLVLVSSPGDLTALK
jgi:hypothetical protein